jgi:hypothetical protein
MSSRTREAPPLGVAIEVGGLTQVAEPPLALAGNQLPKKLEHFPTGMNRLGFPKRRESDSSWMLAREVSMHDQGAFR